MPSRSSKLNKKDPSDFKMRFIVAGFIMFFAFTILGGRLWYLQVIKGDELRERSENNRIRSQEIRPLRGLIIDSRGMILVDNIASFDIAIIPSEAKDPAFVVSELKRLYEGRNLSYAGSPTLDLGRRRFLPLSLERDVAWEKLALVEASSAMLPGIVVDVVPVRNYTMGPVMAHVLGYVGEISPAELRHPQYRDHRPGAIIGKSGIERAVDHLLMGKSGGEQVEVNVAGQKLNVLAMVDAVPGSNVVTTLDGELQQVCWEAFDGDAGSIVVMNPRDGSILAMVSKPSFDPNLFNRGIKFRDWEAFSSDRMAPFKNRSVASLYPPASLFKLVVAAAALDQGLISAEDTIVCRGTFPFGDRTFRCWRREGHGALNLRQAIVQSCDVFFYTLGLQLGVDTIAEYARAFGLGSLTGIEIAGEKEGLVPTRGWKLQQLREPWQQGETVSVSIGQGFLGATPLQLVRVFASLSNGGMLYKPRILDRIESPQGDLIESFPAEPIGRLPLSAEHIKLLNSAMWGVVNEPRGTGRAAHRKERDVCGKTGTAQVVSMPDDDKSKESEIPYRFRDHALFACSVPCEDPRITVLVVVEHGGHGGSAAAPIAKKVVDWYMKNRPEDPAYAIFSDKGSMEKQP
ncbi:MAG: penicillin-binding protein 2 [Syntrophales bacterium]|nr:penicillin-binding protein 2 [Syntrophales bacterium]